jgi:hypothetical protein
VCHGSARRAGSGGPQELLKLALLCRHTCQTLVQIFALDGMLIFLRLYLSLISLD